MKEDWSKKSLAGKQAAMDQVSAYIRDIIAPAARNMMASFMKEGFTRKEAFELVKENFNITVISEDDEEDELC